MKYLIICNGIEYIDYEYLDGDVSYIPKSIEDEEMSETIVNYSQYQDDNNELVKLFLEQNISVELFYARKEYGKVLKEELLVKTKNNTLY